MKSRKKVEKDSPVHKIIVGSMEAPAKVFLLFLVLSDWLKLIHLKSRMECGFSDIFRAISVAP